MGLLSTIGAASGRAFGFTRSAIAQAVDAYFNLTTLLLPGNGTNGAQNNTFLDSSSNNFSITRNGNTTQGTFSPFSQTGWSNYFDGSSVLSNTTTTSTGFNLSTGSFTIEAWVYVTAITAYQYVVSLANTAGNDSGLVFGLDNTGKPYIGNGVVLGKSGSTAISANSWTHIAVVSDGTNIQFYTNGTANGSAQAFNPNTAQYFYVGRSAAGSNALTGYISNVRVTKGQQLYTGAFTPSTSALTTTSQGATATNVHLLTCQSNRFVDNGTNTFAITVTGTPSVQAFSPFAPQFQWTPSVIGGSGYFDGTGDYLTAASNAAFGFGTGDATIEAWIYPTTVSGTQVFIETRVGAAAGIGFYLAGATLSVARDSNNVLMQGGIVVANAWNHVVWSRVGSTNRLFLNGTETTSATNSTSYPTAKCEVGANDTGGQNFNGYMSSVRVVKGSGVSSVTVPTAPLTNITNTSLLLNFTNAGITDATAKNVLETVGNAQISTTQSKWGGGSIYMDGTGDNLVVGPNPLLNFGASDFTIEFWIYPTTFTGGISPMYSTLNRAKADVLAFDVNTGGSMGMYATPSGGSVWSLLNANNVGTLTANTWQHVALVRSGSTWSAYINGVRGSGFPVTNAAALASIDGFNIGFNGAGGGYLNGYMDDIRVSRYARYSGASFTPPAAAFALQ